MKTIDILKQQLSKEELKQFYSSVKPYDVSRAVEKSKFWEKLEGVKIEEIVKIIEEEDYLIYTDNNVETVTNIINTDTLYFADTECVDGMVRPVKYQPFKTLFKTAGKIIIENDLCDEFLNKDEKTDFNVNTTKGQIEYSQFYADKGLLHGFVGNSCPQVYYSKEEETIIIGVDYDEETEEPILLNDTYKKLCQVVTDLWWYSICDVNSISNASEYNQYDITPGTWELEHYYGICSSEYHEKPFAKLRLIK